MMSPKFFEHRFARWFAFSYQLSAGRHVPLRADDLAKGVRRLNFKFSKHALEELERRQIPRTTIERVLESPDQKLPVLEEIICYQSRVNFGGKQYLLRKLAFYRDRGNIARSALWRLARFVQDLSWRGNRRGYPAGDHSLSAAHARSTMAGRKKGRP